MPKASTNPFFQKLMEDPSSAQPLFFPYARLCEKTMEVCNWLQWQQNSDTFWTPSPLKLFLQNVATGSNHLPFSVLIQIVQENHTENHVSSTQKITKSWRCFLGIYFRYQAALGYLSNYTWILSWCENLNKYFCQQRRMPPVTKGMFDACFWLFSSMLQFFVSDPHSQKIWISFLQIFS